MQFLHSGYFYALPVLLVPIFIHLFQLRRFKKYDFTNVTLLKKIKFKTRKSSQIKKWIILILRLLIIVFIIFAFSQPYFSNNKSIDTPSETVLYLDNSFSMQALGANGPLFKRAVQDVISEIKEGQKLTLLTNDVIYQSTELKDIKNKLLSVKYSPNQLSLNNVILKAASLFSSSKTSLKTIVVVSDFQKIDKEELANTDTKIKVVLVPLLPLNKINNYIDKVSIESSLNSINLLNITAKTNTKNIDSIPITLFREDKIIGKSILEKSKNYKTSFEIQKIDGFKGKVSIEDSQVHFDDTFYFNIPKKNKISVLAISENTSSIFLKKIYSKDEFIFKNQDHKSLNINKINDANLIILNGVNNISSALINSLKNFMTNGGTILLIPGKQGNIVSYNQLISTQSNHYFQPKKSIVKSITQIEFNHFIFKDVFKTKVSNFQYPFVKSYYPITTLANKILSFENQQAFLSQLNSLFVFTADLDLKNSNFTKSPLIVPTLYNIGKFSLSNPPLYYFTETKNSFELKVDLKNDDILKLSRNEEEFIPIQLNLSSKVRVTTEKLPNKPGHYALITNNDTITNISYNYDRNESLLKYNNLADMKGYIINNSLQKTLENINSESNVTWLWKWFIIFAIILLAFEMLILKYFK
ncbi:BatA domain-containing protein [Flavobacteriaceae bacterium]|nr:BatA domain-containing protein [Flavobacteriaceae bacterium]